MTFNPPSQIRVAIYVLSVFINAVMGVFLAGEVKIPLAIIAVVAGYNAVVALMASANVTPDEL